MTNIFDITLIYVDEENFHRSIHHVEPETKIIDFFTKINIQSICPSFDFKNTKFGIFGKIVRSNYILQADDRVEIYFPVKVDAKTRRINRLDKKN
tara:strand:+ start:71 stop:355 length:285 start_codon:yes stop_codon:yes gene_type:complete